MDEAEFEKQREERTTTRNDRISYKLGQGFGLASVVALGLFAGASALFGGCTLKNKDGVSAGTMPGVGEHKGYISFNQNGITYKDAGFDGTLDSIAYNKDGKRVILTKEDEGFEEHIQGYKKAREDYANGNLR